MVYIDGEVLDKFFEASSGGLAADEIKLASNEYFVLGDNRVGSEDSRISTIGNVTEDMIIGNAWIRLLPVKRIGFIK